MPTILTPYQIRDAIKTANTALEKPKRILPTSKQKINYYVTSYNALKHMQSEFGLLEAYQMGMLSQTEFHTKLETLIENRYKG